MKVRMLKTSRGAVDAAGTVVGTHVAGEEYDLLDSTAVVYLTEGWAEEADPFPAAPKVEDTPPAPVLEAPAEVKPLAPAKTVARKQPAKRKGAAKR